MVIQGSSVVSGSPTDVLGLVAFPTDANFTPPVGTASGYILTVTSLVNLTATRNLVLPNVAGNFYWIFNNTSGAQSIQAIGASGTGITIATAKKAGVYFDGTNWLRLTADI